jgi:hypothetical protein
LHVRLYILALDVDLFVETIVIHNVFDSCVFQDIILTFDCLFRGLNLCVNFLLFLGQL